LEATTLTSLPGDDGPSLVAHDAADADFDPSRGHSLVVVGANALMAATSFGAVASIVIAIGRHLMR
jgi:hypothetical protein